MGCTFQLFAPDVTVVDGWENKTYGCTVDLINLLLILIPGLLLDIENLPVYIYK